MASLTVNRLLAMEKSLRERLGQLNEAKSGSLKESHWADPQKTEKPVYDVRKIDKRIVAINKALFEINHMVKESNAKTEIIIDLNYNELVSEIE